VTILAVCLFVVGGTLGLSFYLGLKKMLVETAQPENIIVVSKGAATEAGSKLQVETANKLVLVPGIKRTGDTPVAARELVTRVYVATGSAYEDPVSIRGFDAQSAAIHRITVLKGTLPDPKSLDIIVGRRVAETHSNLTIGTEIHLPAGSCKITGVFAADGSPLEDEVWTPRAALELHVHTKLSSSLMLVAEDAARVPEIVDKINDSKDLNAQAASVAQFRQDSAGLGVIARTVFMLLALLSVIATFAIATTMNAAALARMPELAALAAIGIRRRYLARMVLVESTLLAIGGAVLGIVVCAILRSQLGGVLALGATPVEIVSTARIVPIAIGLGAIVGIIGGFSAALLVRRLDVIRSLR